MMQTLFIEWEMQEYLESFEGMGIERFIVTPLQYAMRRKTPDGYAPNLPVGEAFQVGDFTFEVRAHQGGRMVCEMTKVSASWLKSLGIQVDGQGKLTFPLPPELRPFKSK